MSFVHLDVDTVEARVKAAPDAEALKAIVAEIGILPGSQATLYTAQELIEHIETAMRVPALVNRVTRTLGLRARLLELLGQPAPPAPDAKPREPGTTTVGALAREGSAR